MSRCVSCPPRLLLPGGGTVSASFTASLSCGFFSQCHEHLPFLSLLPCRHDLTLPDSLCPTIQEPDAAPEVTSAPAAQSRTLLCAHCLVFVTHTHLSRLLQGQSDSPALRGQGSSPSTQPKKSLCSHLPSSSE